MRSICISIVATLVLAGTAKSDSEQNGGYTHHSISIESLQLGEVVGQISIDLPRNRLVGPTQLTTGFHANGIFTMDLDSGELQVGYSDDTQSRTEAYAALAINTATNTWYTYDSPPDQSAPQEIIAINGSTGEATRVALPNENLWMVYEGAMYVDEDRNQVYVVCDAAATVDPRVIVLDGATNTWLPHQFDLEQWPGYGYDVSFAAIPTADRLYIGITNQLTLVDMATSTVLNHIEVGGSITGIDTDRGTHGGRIYVACTDPNGHAGHATLYEMNAETLAINRTLTQLPAVSKDVFWNPHDDHVYVAGNNGNWSGKPCNAHSGISVVGFTHFKLIDWIPLDHIEGSLCGNGTSTYASFGQILEQSPPIGCISQNAFQELDFSAPLAGDLDADGDVDSDDLSQLHSELGICHSDVNHDGATNIDDLLLLMDGWNSVCP